MIIPGRSKPTMHNFPMNCLKWGSQRFLRCMKVNPVTDPRSAVLGNDKSVRPVETGYISPACNGDEEHRMVRLKLARESHVEDDKVIDSTVSNDKEETQMDAVSRPWNMRKRRAACRVPPPDGAGERNSDLSPPAMDNRTPQLRSNTAAPPQKERRNFSISLSASEIEDDYFALLGRKPPRRAKKRPRNIQKQLDALFPGMCLSEMTPERYRVPDLPESRKRHAVEGGRNCDRDRLNAHGFRRPLGPAAGGQDQ